MVNATETAAVRVNPHLIDDLDDNEIYRLEELLLGRDEEARPYLQEASKP